jgi:hypothetical protein
MDVPRRGRGENRAKTTLFALFTGGVAGSPIARFILDLDAARTQLDDLTAHQDALLRVHFEEQL